MATMKFLTIPNGNVGYQDSAGTGTLTNDGSVTYAAGYWSGVQGASNESLSLPAVTNAANPAAGSLVVRFRTPAGWGGYRTVVQIGSLSFGNNYHSYIRFDPSGQMEIDGIAGSAFGDPNIGAPLSTSTNYFVYLEWDGTTMKAAIENAALTSWTHTAVTSFAAAAPMYIAYGTIAGALEGQVDGLAIFDEPLTDAERLYVRSQTTPWTWGMGLSAPLDSYIDVLPVTGTNLSAPTLVLP